MFKERTDSSIEREKGIVTAPSAAEELTQPAEQRAEWLKDVAENPEFERQTQERRLLQERLDAILSQIQRPDTSLQDAVKEGLIPEQSVAKLYRSLTGLLGADSDYRRAALYIPFEFLPNKSWLTESKELQSEITSFKASYMETWKRLLYVHDVRANFIDGDVLEVDRREGELEYVVKAAHLIPKLIESGMLSVEEVLQIAEDIDHPTLKQSIEGALAVTDDIKPFNTQELEKIKAAGFDLEQYSVESASRPSVDAADVVPMAIEKRLNARLTDIEHASYGDVTLKREKWLKKQARLQAIDQESELIFSGIDRHLLLPEQLDDVLDLNPSTQEALIDGIRKAVELRGYDGEEGKSMYTEYQKILLTLWRGGDASLRPSLSKTFCHFHALGIIDDAQLHLLGIRIPALAGPYSKNSEQSADDLKPIKRVAAAIKRHAEVSRYMHPSLIVYGSKIKGYGDEHADIDASVFIRPETSPEQREHVLSVIAQICQSEGVDPEELTEFWTQKTPNGLEVRNDIEQSTVAEPSWTHVLFNGTWEGDPEDIQEIKHDLLVPYFYNQDESHRRLHLEEIERDALQYRLMHRGYERFYPSFGGLHTPRSKVIDGQSAFYDSGYRRMAMQLFARNVFLPKLKT